MRVTNQMMTDFIITSTGRAKSAYFESVRRINSGRRVLKPSDDAPAAQQSIDQTRLLAQLKTMAHSITVVGIDLKAAELTVRHGSELITEALSLTIQMANDAYNAANRSSAANRVDQIRDELIELVNRQQPGGRFLFGGVADRTPPYDAVTGAYLGSPTNRAVEVAPGLDIDATVTGAESFGDPEIIFTALENLSTALQANDLAGIQATIDSLQQVIDDFSSSLSDLGSRLMVLMDAAVLNDDLSVQTQIRRSELIDVDLASEITIMKSAETALAASLETGRNFMQFSMFNWR